ncbi:MAG: exodeoxyribonuclease VII large subunit [Alphaproteobacteria bacterium]
MTDPTPDHNDAALTVSQIAGQIKRVVEGEFGHVRVRGEISRFTRAGSGHCYWSLKDDKAVLDAVMWKTVAGRLAFRPEEGLEVICEGKLTTYPGRSRYQIVVERMEPAGEGALMAMLEARKKQLAAEGLFDQDRKKPLPKLPATIGVVTSPTGAVIRDILHRLNDRFPRHVLVWPVLVQGEGAANQIAEAIRGFNAIPAQGGATPRPDLLIVARGGGSLEDLWCFNEEIVARAAADSDIPLISAVGHETDTTLIDFVSDLRAPTPTAAAEIAVPERRELMTQTLELAARMSRAQSRILTERQDRLAGLSRGLPRADKLFAMPRQQFDRLAADLPRALRTRLNAARLALTRQGAGLRPTAIITATRNARSTLTSLDGRFTRSWPRHQDNYAKRLARAGQLLDAYSHQGVLARGFALVMGPDGKPVRHKKDTWPGEDVTLTFVDGDVSARIESGGHGRATRPAKTKKGRATRPTTTKPASSAKKAATKPSDAPKQASLFDEE